MNLMNNITFRNFPADKRITSSRLPPLEASVASGDTPFYFFSLALFSSFENCRNYSSMQIFQRLPDGLAIEVRQAVSMASARPVGAAAFGNPAWDSANLCSGVLAGASCWSWGGRVTDFHVKISHKQSKPSSCVFAESAAFS